MCPGVTTCPRAPVRKPLPWGGHQPCALCTGDNCTGVKGVLFLRGCHSRHSPACCVIWDFPSDADGFGLFRFAPAMAPCRASHLLSNRLLSVFCEALGQVRYCMWLHSNAVKHVRWWCLRSTTGKLQLGRGSDSSEAPCLPHTVFV